MTRQSHREHMEKIYQEHLEKVRECIEQGQLWKARDRCMGMIGYQPFREELCRLAAEIYYKMGDFPRAGVYWLVTLDDSEEARNCIDWAIREYGANLPRQYRKRIASAHLPPEIVKRVDQRLKQAGVKGGVWGLRGRKGPGKSTDEPGSKDQLSEKAFIIGCLCILGFAGFLLIYGFVRLLMDLFSFWG